MKYTCVICGFSEGWEETDDIHGDMWSCEICGDIFCSKCLIDAIGARKYWEMMQSGEYIICPECFRRVENMCKKSEWSKSYDSVRGIGDVL